MSNTNEQFPSDLAEQLANAFLADDDFLTDEQDSHLEQVAIQTRPPRNDKEVSQFLRCIELSPDGALQRNWADKYALKERIGVGMSTVYRAEQVDMANRSVVIKLPSSEDEAACIRLERESQLLGRLRGTAAVHFLVPIEFGRWHGTAYLVTEFLAGDNLKTLINGESSRLEVLEACEIVRQAASGLSIAHGVGVIHRDVKPSNLILGDDEIVRVLDFGIAQDQRQMNPGRLTETNMVPGTLAYMSPEQVKGEEVDHRSDIYSLGLVFAELLAITKSNGNAEVESCAKAIAAKMTARIPEDRQTNMDQVTEELETLLIAVGRKPVLRRSDPGRHDVQTESRPLDGMRLLLPAVAGLLLGVAIMFGWKLLGWKMLPSSPRAAATMQPMASNASKDASRLSTDPSRLKAPPSTTLQGRNTGGSLPDDPLLAWVESKGGTYLVRSDGPLKLNLTKTAVTDDDLSRLQNVKRRLDLDLAFCKSITGAGFVHIPQDIARISLQGCPLTPAAWTQLAQRTIEGLDLSFSQLSSNEVSFIANLRGLRFLYLRNTNLTDDFLEVITASQSGLEILDISGSAVTDAGLKHLRTCSQLRVLELAHLPVGPVGIETLAELPLLRELRLNGTHLGDDDVRRIVSIIPANLTKLGLSNTRASDNSVLAISDRLENLAELTLAGTFITPDCEQDFYSMDTLQAMDLRETRIIDLSELKRQLDCPIQIGEIK